MRRSAISRFREILSALAAALLLAAPAGADTVRVGLDQARDMAVQALKAGDPGLAIALARGLLQANPDVTQDCACSTLRARRIAIITKSIGRHRHCASPVDLPECSR